MLLVLIWALCCVAAVYKERHLLWAFLCMAPLGLISIEWVSQPEHASPDFGIYPWGAIGMFLAISVVIAGTCTLSIVLAALKCRKSEPRIP